ncbi:MAG: sensor histidine kinase [Nitrospira sp.]|nr:sensor histidine kinase [Nitrospira sp.]
MEKPKKGLGVLKGFRTSRPYGEMCPMDRDASTNERDIVPYTYVKSYSKHDVATALKAMEQRVNMLLEDRYRLAQDLHDCILQSLYAIGLTLEGARQSESSLSSAVQETYDQAVTQLNHLIRDVRAMIESLEAGTIREFDFSAELSVLQATYEQGGRLTIRLDLDETALNNLTREEQREILNIVREAISNCARHAEATEAVVAIRMRGSRVRVSIADNGRGFTLSSGCRKGYGLTNMETRARKLGGSFRLSSILGRGTTVMIDLPLSSVLTLA